MTQIERLQNNWMGWGGMAQEDKDLMRAINKARYGDILWRKTGEVRPKNDNVFRISSIYCISKDYQPEPEPPEHPGYVLRKVLSRNSFPPNSTAARSLSEAVDYGCCGYVFKEASNVMWNAPIAFVDKFKRLWRTGKEDREPATLGWVCFKEEG